MLSPGARRSLPSALALFGSLASCGAAAPREAAPTPAIEQAADAGAPTPTGTLSRQSIRVTIRTSLGDVRACYEHGLAGERNLAGRVIISFIIGADGTVATSQIMTNDLRPTGEIADGVSECIREVVSRLRFERPSGGGVVGVNYPFVLDAIDGEGSAAGAEGTDGWRPLPADE